MKDFYSTKVYFAKLDRYFRAVNYLTASQLYLLDNPLLKKPLKREDIKSKIVGHWGTCPGQNFIYAHLNRVINKYSQSSILISGPGHGGNFFVSNSYVEGHYTEVYPEVSQDEKGLKKLFKQFSFPCGISSHVAPEVPGSINEGGELGYSLAHGYGAIFDNPNLLATVVVGDGEAETGPLATSWFSNKFVNPKTDGAVLPILHLNGYKIANPTILARISKKDLIKYFEGMGYKPYLVSGDNPILMHRKMAKAMDSCMENIRQIQKDAKEKNKLSDIVWPMIILETPKGWLGPKFVNGKQIEGTFRAHQVPVTMDNKGDTKLVEDWLKSYKPEELFDEHGRVLEDIKSLCPVGNMRISANSAANGGKLLKELILPKIDDYAVVFKGHGTIASQDMLELGKYIKDVFVLNSKNNNFRLFSPDEAKSNRLYKAFDVTKRRFNANLLPTDEDLSVDGKIMDSYLSEHMCEGWLEGYLLTGRHGTFVSYEAFIRIVDSMISQHFKWLQNCKEIEWREDISSLNLILSSNVWQQDHNGFTHQEPGLLDHLISKNNITSVYLPPDANCLINCYDRCLKTKNHINTIISSKHPSYQWLNMSDAKKHCKEGIGIWEWAGNCKKEEPDLVIASCGDTPTLEALACSKYLMKNLPYLKIRFVNVVNLLKLSPSEFNNEGLTDDEYDAIFTKNKPIIFNFHGYPTLIHELTYRRKNQDLHVTGYRERGAITTAFDMRVLNKIDRYNFTLMALKFVKNIKKTDYARILHETNEKLVQHKKYIAEYGTDMPEIKDWNWNSK